MKTCNKNGKNKPERLPLVQVSQEVRAFCQTTRTRTRGDVRLLPRGTEVTARAEGPREAGRCPNGKRQDGFFP